MAILIVHILLVLLVTYTFVIRRDLLYPPFIVALVWLMVVPAAYMQALGSGYDVSPYTTLFLFVGTVLFFAGSLITTHRYGTNIVPVRPQVTKYPTPHGSLLLLTIAAIILPFYVLRAIEMGGGGPTDNWFINLRIAASRNQGYGWTEYGVSVSVVAVLVFQIRRIATTCRRDTLLFWISLTIGAVYAGLATGRTFVLLLACAAAGPLLVTRRLRVARVAPIAAVLATAVFVLFAVTLRKGVSLQVGSTAEFLLALVNAISGYLVAGFYGLESIIRDGYPDIEGSYTLRFFASVASSAGVDVSRPPITMEFVSYPVSTNVYTFYAPYIIDYNFIVAALAAGFWGMIYGGLYSRIVKANVSAGAVAVYSVGLYPLIMMFFQEQFMTLLSTWIQMWILWFVAVRLGAPRASLVWRRVS